MGTHEDRKKSDSPEGLEEELRKLRLELLSAREELLALQKNHDRLSYKTLSALIEIVSRVPGLAKCASISLRLLWFPIRFFARADRQTFRHKALVLISGVVNRIRLLYWYFGYCFFQRRPLVGILLVEHLGDIVACEPLTRYAKRRFPKAFLIWMAKAEYRELFQANPHVDRFCPVTCHHEGSRLISAPFFRTGWDLNLPERICPRCRGSRQVVPSTITSQNYFHFGNLLSVFSQCAGIPPIDDAPRLYLPRSTRKTAHRLGLSEDFIVFHRSSNDRSKEWPVESWKELIRLIAGDFGLAFVEIGLHSDLDAPAVKNLCGRLTILQSGEIIDRARMFIGIDSGPAHLANALGKEGVILMGKYKAFETYQPFSGHYQKGSLATLVRAKGPVSLLPVDAVREAVAGRLNGSARSY